MSNEVKIDEPKDFFGKLYPYICDDEITDIDYNGRMLWITKSSNERTAVLDCDIDEGFVEQFSKRVANYVSKPFHKMSPVLEAETDCLRITFVHESVAKPGRSFCIRKSLPKVRLKTETILSEGYATREVLAFLQNCVRANMNIVFCGEPGVGKTEACKYFSQFICENRRVITIEDNPEWHYSMINPKADCIEIKVTPDMDYTTAIKTSLRLNPKWIMLSEARSTEVRYLLESLSTGVSGMTTIHTDDVRKIPERIVNMAGVTNDAHRLERDTYSFVNIGVLIKRGESVEGGKHKVRRYIDQIACFCVEEGRNLTYMLLDEGNLEVDNIPPSLKRKFAANGIKKPFELKEKKEVNRERDTQSILPLPADIRGGTYIGKKKIIG